MSKTASSTEKSERRLIKALSHPIRYRVLEKLNERPASPRALSRELGEPLGNVAYHVKVLADNEAIELVETRQVRGAVEHVYRASVRPWFTDEQWAQLPQSVRDEFQRTTIDGMWRHLVEAAERGGLSRPDTHVSWTTLDLDESGHEAMAALLTETVERALQIHSEVAGRLSGLPASERHSQRTELHILHYQRPPAP